MRILRSGGWLEASLTFSLDRIYRIYMIFLHSQFPDETEKMQSAFGGEGLFSLLGMPVLSFDLYTVGAKAMLFALCAMRGHSSAP